MSKGEHRRFTAEQKLEILREAEQPGVTVSQVCRRNALAPSVFYRWRAVAQRGSALALKQDAKRTPRKDDRQARQEAEMARLRAVIAEITAENLELKKRFEVGGFIPCTGREQSGGDADRSAHETPIRLASASHAGGAGCAAERVLRLEAARESA